MATTGTAYVTVKEGAVSPNFAGTWYDRDYAKNLAGEMQKELQDSIEDLKDVLDAYSPTTPDIETNLPDIEGPAFPPPLVLEDLVLNDRWPTDYPATPNLLDYGDLDFSFLEPIPPDEIDLSFDWQEGEYTSEIWNALFTRVYNEIVSGHHGLTQEVYDAVLAHEREARRINQDREYRKALDSVGSKGFNLPGGMVAGLQAELFRERAKLDQDALNSLMIKDFDVAVDMTKFYLSLGLDMEKLLRAAFDAAQNRGLAATKAAKEFIVKAYSENVKLYLAKWDGIKAKLEALKIKVSAITEHNTGLLDAFDKHWSGIETQVKAIASENTSKIAVQDSQIRNQALKVDTIAKQWTSILQKATAELAQIKLEIDTTLALANIELEAYDKQANLAERITEAIAKISAQAMASALGTINTSVSESHSVTAARSESWGHSESASESHAYEEE
jgi:hypothetical protein